MDTGSVSPFDLQRMIIGDHPLLFSIEIVVRTIIVYVYALLLLRWLGSRTIGQLSTVEFLLVIALGSAVGDAMFYPDVPLLHALIVVTVVVFANKGLDVLIARTRKGEKAIDGTAELLVRDGVFSRAFLDGTTMGIGEAQQQLRHHGIEHLGQVREAYTEPDGEVTVFKQPEDTVRPGLPIVPPWEIDDPPKIAAHERRHKTAILACRRCGTIREVSGGAQPGACGTCGNELWTLATMPRTGAAKGSTADGRQRQVA
jgi:uncharacterized membrane protein YcaP (DUF421 family)